MVGRREHFIVRARLQQASPVHHADAVGERAHHREVVRDEQHRDPVAGAQPAQQVQDARLHRDVERGEHLVAEQQGGVHGEGAGDGDALAFAPRELVGKAIRVVRVQAHVVEGGGHSGVQFRSGHVSQQLQGAGEDVPNPHPRIERRIRVLEHVLDEAPEFRRACRHPARRRLAAEQDPSRAGREQSAHRARDGGLAAAGLSDQCKGLALRDAERDLVHHRGRSAAKGAGESRGGGTVRD